MSAKTKRIERSQRFKRAWRGENRKKAVSPVVATLILILIAVAAAAALYLWLVVWQGNITGGIGNQHAEPTLQVGGSTSVYPFSSLAATWFEQNNSDVVISDNQGGTGAGMVALCDGNVQLGASSTPQTVALLESSYGCSSTYASTITITTIAYDAVDVVVQGTNVHGLLSISADTLNDIYEAGSSTGPSAYISSMDGYANTSVTGGVSVKVTYDSALAWDQIPAAVGGASLSGLANQVTDATTATEIPGAIDPTGGGFCTATGYTSDWCDAALIAGSDATAYSGTPCGFVLCAGGSSTTGATDGPTASILPIERSDASGTTQTFEAKILGYGSGPGTSATSWAGETSSTPWLAQGSASTFANLGYGGCGSNNLLSDCGFTYPTAQQGNGNPGVLSIVAGNPNAIGYASDGLARTTSGVGLNGIIPFLGLGEGVSGQGLTGTSMSTYKFGGVVPTTGTSGTIAAGLTSSTTEPNYVGGRPFQLISLEPLTGIAQEWVTFITDPAVNAALASSTAEVGLYQVI